MNSRKPRLFYVYTSAWYQGSNKDAYDRSLRERFIVDYSRSLGYDCRLLFISYSTQIEKMIDATSGIFFPVDDPVCKNAGKHTSLALLKYIESEKPDFILFKGMGNLLSRWLIAKSSHNFRWGYIVGGKTYDIGLRFSSYVLAEHDFQLKAYFGSHHEKGIADLLPKLLNQNDIYDESKADKEFDIVSVGRLSPHKNYKALIPFFKNYRVAIIGDGPCYDELKKIADLYPNVYMPGSMPRKDVLNVIKRSFLFVHPCRWEEGLEGFPRVIAESFSCNVPVLVFRKTVPSGFKHGVHGFMVEEDEFETSIHSLLKDTAKLTWMGKNAYDYAKANFSKNRVEKAIEMMYKRLNLSGNGIQLRNFKSILGIMYIRAFENARHFKSQLLNK
jgi:glycosyltransferase involved in cell wall biosynthesis